jgi:hypothetical protein
MPKSMAWRHQIRRLRIATMRASQLPVVVAFPVESVLRPSVVATLGGPQWFLSMAMLRVSLFAARSASERHVRVVPRAKSLAGTFGDSAYVWFILGCGPGQPEAGVVRAKLDNASGRAAFRARRQLGRVLRLQAVTATFSSGRLMQAASTATQ